MDKKNFVCLVEDLNDKAVELMNLTNMNENKYFHISDMSFKMLKRERYLSDYLEKLNLLKISIKRVERKNKNHIIIDLENTEEVENLYNWELPIEVIKEIIKEIRSVQIKK